MNKTAVKKPMRAPAAPLRKAKPQPPSTSYDVGLLDYAAEVRRELKKELDAASLRVSRLLAWSETDPVPSRDTSELRRIARAIRQVGRLLECEGWNLSELRGRLQSCAEVKPASEAAR